MNHCCLCNRPTVPINLITVPLRGIRSAYVCRECAKSVAAAVRSRVEWDWVERTA